MKALILTLTIASEAPTSYPTLFCEGEQYTSEVGEQFTSDCSPANKNLTVTACNPSSYQDKLEWGVANELYTCPPSYCVWYSLYLAFLWRNTQSCYEEKYYTEDESDSAGIKCWNTNWGAFYIDGSLNESLSSICSETVPTSEPTEVPTVFTSRSPTTNPTLMPTSSPTKNPTKIPTRSPTENPTPVPTVSPTDHPSSDPTLDPSNRPSQFPTADPSDTPTYIPTRSPTENSTEVPTIWPTDDPSEAPTAVPSDSPSQVPTVAPSNSTDFPAGNYIFTVEEIEEMTTFEEFIDNVTWVGFATLVMLTWDAVVVALFCCCRHKCYDQKDQNEEVKASTYPQTEEHQKSERLRQSNSQSYSSCQSTSQCDWKETRTRKESDGGPTFVKSHTTVNYGAVNPNDKLGRQRTYPSTVGTHPTRERKYPATEMSSAGGFTTKHVRSHQQITNEEQKYNAMNRTGPRDKVFSGEAGGVPVPNKPKGQHKRISTDEEIDIVTEYEERKDEAQVEEEYYVANSDRYYGSNGVQGRSQPNSEQHYGSNGVHRSFYDTRFQNVGYRNSHSEL